MIVTMMIVKVMIMTVLEKDYGEVRDAKNPACDQISMMTVATRWKTKDSLMVMYGDRGVEKDPEFRLHTQVGIDSLEAEEDAGEEYWNADRKKNIQM